MHETPKERRPLNLKGFPMGGTAPEGGPPHPSGGPPGSSVFALRCASSAVPPQCGGLCCLPRSPQDFVQPDGCSSPEASRQAPGLPPPQNPESFCVDSLRSALTTRRPQAFTIRRMSVSATAVFQAIFRTDKQHTFENNADRPEGRACRVEATILSTNTGLLAHRAITG